MAGGDYDLSSFQYAFSTIAQTLATGFALLAAVVMYRIQSLTATFPGRAKPIEANLDHSKQANSNNNMDHANASGDWDRWLSIANAINIRKLDDKQKLIDIKLQFLHLSNDITHIVKLKRDTKDALNWTIGTIALSLVCVPFINKCIITTITWYGLAWVAVIAATASAIVCLLKYKPVVLEVVSPPRPFGTDGK
jgi:hypothetical protein